RFTIPREAFVERVSDIIDRSFPVCDEVFKLAGLAPPQIDEAVLVGGTTRVPYAQQRVAAYFGKTPRTGVNPDEAAALGGPGRGGRGRRRGRCGPRRRPGARPRRPRRRARAARGGARSRRSARGAPARRARSWRR